MGTFCCCSPSSAAKGLQGKEAESCSALHVTTLSGMIGAGKAWVSLVKEETRRGGRLEGQHGVAESCCHLTLGQQP